MCRNTSVGIVLIVILFAGMLPSLPSFTSIAQAAPIAENEPNDSAATAQPLAQIGLDNAVEGAITVGDVDWYRFEAIANRTYVIELVNVGANLGVTGSNCDFTTERGVGLQVYTAGVITNPIIESVAASCGMRGSSTIHNFVEFTANTSGDFYIYVIPNKSTVSGTYTLRILPEHTDPAAAWNMQTAEPNNRAANAFPLEPGYANTRTFAIAQIDSPFSVTSEVDFDWYRFEAVANRTYVIELVNVGANLGVTGSNCDFTTERGVGLQVYTAGVITNPIIESVAASCDMRGSSTIHNFVEFRPGTDNTYYIRVVPNADNVSGTYTIRVLPEHTDQAAAWDEQTGEPNNRVANAFLIDTDRPYTFTIEPRNAQFSTSIQVDFDWYRFTAKADETHTIELTGVSDALSAQGTNCDFSTDDGVGLQIYSANAPVTLEGSLVVAQCDALFEGTLHNRVTFESGSNETFYIHVVPNADNVSGTYTLQIISESGPDDGGDGPGRDDHRVYLPLLRR